MSEALIEVIYPDGATALVSADLLDALIATAKISAFRREDGWVQLDGEGGGLRDYGRRSSYQGPERRAPWQKKNS